MSSSLSSGKGGGASSRYAASINSSSGRSGTSSFGRMAVDRPGRLDSKSRGGGSSLYMVTVSFVSNESRRWVGTPSDLPGQGADSSFFALDSPSSMYSAGMTISSGD